MNQNYSPKKWAMIVAALLAWQCAAVSADDVFWNVTGPDDWNNGANWVLAGGLPAGAPPSTDFGDVAVIANGGTVDVLSPVPNVTGLRVNAGTVNIKQGGSLSVLNGFGGADGAGGTGGGGLLNLTGNAILDIDSNFDNSGELKLTGNTVNMDVGGQFTNFGTLVADITGPNHSAIDVAGPASLGGTLKLQFTGYVPTATDKWTIIDATSVVGSFGAVDASGGPPLPFGAVYDVTVDAATARVQVGLIGKLVATIDKGTGGVTIRHTFGGPINIYGYELASGSDAFDPSNGEWSSLDDGNVGAWQEIGSPNANLIAELNPTGTLSLSTGQSRSLGTPYAFQPAAFGDSMETPVTFKYAQQGKVVEGLVEFVGRDNNFVLTVDPATGQAVLENQSRFYSADLIGYSIGSVGGALRPANGQWSSLDDANLGGANAWQEANPSANLLSELNPLSETSFNTGGCVALGSLFNTAGAADLTLAYALENGQVRQGIVKYGTLPSVCELGPVAGLGDTDLDGDVDLDDLNNVRNFFGTPSTEGDADHDGDTDLDDLNAVRNFFGGPPGGPSSVPEPHSAALALLGVVGAWFARRAKNRRS